MPVLGLLEFGDSSFERKAGFTTTKLRKKRLDSYSMFPLFTYWLLQIAIESKEGKL
jgi:hypothetical protein